MGLHGLSGESRALIKCYLRCYLAGACFNPRGYHNVGLSYAIYPGLAAIHKSGKELRAARRRYIRHFNTHLFWLPCLVGIFLSAERYIASGHMPPKMVDRLKNTAAYTLSAIGDSVFAGSLLIFWALSSICLLLAGFRVLPLLLGVIFFLGVQVFRAYTFWAGHRLGLAFLERLRKWDLINWGQRLKYVNAALLVCLWLLVWPRTPHWEDWLGTTLGMAALARFLYRRQVPREVVLVVILAVMGALPWLTRWVSGLA
ncbi:MAG: PTS system mannose/fructose/sorbose family transporter subunit IID [Desulfovibrionaceae bacterium]